VPRPLDLGTKPVLLFVVGEVVVGVHREPHKVGERVRILTDE